MAVKLNQTVSLEPCHGDAPQLRIFRNGNYLAQIDTRSGTPTLRISIEQPPESEAVAKTCPKWDKKPLEIDVSQTFSDGDTVRDAYSGKSAVVKMVKSHSHRIPLPVVYFYWKKVRLKNQAFLTGRMRPSILY